MKNKTKKSLRLFMIIGAAVMLVFFFLPTVKLPDGGVAGSEYKWEEVYGVSSVSGLKALQGLQPTERFERLIEQDYSTTKLLETIRILSMGGELLALIKIVFPILIMYLWYSAKNDKRGKLSGVFCLFHTGVCIGFYFLVRHMLGKFGKSAVGLDYRWASSDAIKSSIYTPSLNILLIIEVCIALFMAVLSFLIAFGKLSEDETNIKVVTSALEEAGKNAGASATAAVAGQGVKRFKMFMIVGAVVLLFLFFVPTVKLPDGGISGGQFEWEIVYGVSSVSGLKALQGLKPTEQFESILKMEIPSEKVREFTSILSIRKEPLVLVKLVCPILLLVFWCLERKDKRGKLSGMCSLIHAGICVGFLFVVQSSFKSITALANLGGSGSIKASNYTPSPGFLLFLEVAIALMMAVLSFLIASGKLSEDESNLKTVTAALGDAGKNAGAVAAAVGQGVKQSVNHAKAQAASQRRCQNCGAILDAGSDFCGSCGTKYVAPVLTRCAKCGTELEEADAFCPLCGAKQEKKKERLCMHCGNTFSDDFSFCPHCGKEYVDPEKRVCGNCGAALPIGTDFCGKCGTRYE